MQPFSNYGIWTRPLTARAGSRGTEMRCCGRQNLQLYSQDTLGQVVALMVHWDQSGLKDAEDSPGWYLLLGLQDAIVGAR